VIPDIPPCAAKNRVPDIAVSSTLLVDTWNTASTCHFVSKTHRFAADFWKGNKHIVRNDVHPTVCEQ
jgi:hypothetical protein